MKQKIQESILKVLREDSKSMPLKVLMHKVFCDVKKNTSENYVKKQDFIDGLSNLMEKQLVGSNKFGKYFIDYLDYEDKNVFGEGYLEVNDISGNGYITIKDNVNDYKKSSYFVHKKNLNGAKSGDFVKFCELNITDKKFLTKFSLIDARVKEILNK